MRSIISLIISSDIPPDFSASLFRLYSLDFTRCLGKFISILELICDLVNKPTWSDYGRLPPVIVPDEEWAPQHWVLTLALSLK